MHKLKPNLSIYQSIVRFLITILIIIVTNHFIDSVTLQITIFAIAGIFASTALIRFCLIKAIINKHVIGK